MSTSKPIISTIGTHTFLTQDSIPGSSTGTWSLVNPTRDENKIQVETTKFSLDDRESAHISNPQDEPSSLPLPELEPEREGRAEEATYQTRAKSAKPVKADVKSEPEVASIHETKPLVVISYSCHICDRKFERQCSLSRHLTLHKCDKKFNCDECGQKFSHTFNLERHKNRVHNQDPTGSSVR